MDVMRILDSWDGKTTATLKDAANRLTAEHHPTLLAACRSEDEKMARAASWVLKAAYETGADIPFPADLLSNDTHWEVTLHLLQSVQYTSADFPPEIVARFLDHPRPMLRAWALDAYVRLGAVDAASALDKAALDPAASVRARARNLLRETRASRAPQS